MDIKSDFQDRFVETRQGAVHLKYHQGEGPGLILLHGLGSSVRTWTPMLPFLRPELTVCMIDLLGHGKSDAPRIAYTVDVQVQVVADVADKMDMHQPCVFGHSYGGWIAARYAIYDSVKKLVLEDSAGLASTLAGMPDGKKQDIEKAMLKNPLFSNEDPYVMKSILDSEMAGLGLLSEEDLAMIRVPSLVIWGEDDDILDHGQAQEFANGISGSRVEIVKGAMHVPHFTHPKEVASMLLTFI